jgi:hypothetical protein
MAKHCDCPVLIVFDIFPHLSLTPLTHKITNYCMLLFFGACGNWSSHEDATSGEGQLNSVGQKSHCDNSEVPCTLSNGGGPSDLPSYKLTYK